MGQGCQVHAGPSGHQPLHKLLQVLGTGANREARCHAAADLEPGILPHCPLLLPECSLRCPGAYLPAFSAHIKKADELEQAQVNLLKRDPGGRQAGPRRMRGVAGARQRGHAHRRGPHRWGRDKEAWERV